MSERQGQILYIFRQNTIYGVTATYLSSITGAPEASIRRDIQTLRKLGHNISFASPNGIYRLGK